MEVHLTDDWSYNMDDYFKHYCGGKVFYVCIYATTSSGSKTPLLAESSLLAKIEPMLAFNNYCDKTED